MSHDQGISRADVQRLIRQLDGFARGLGIDPSTAQQIAEMVIIDMPVRANEDRLMEARKRMLIATA